MKLLILIYTIFLIYFNAIGQCTNFNRFFRVTKNSMFASKAKILVLFGSNFEEGRGEIAPSVINWPPVDKEFPFLLYKGLLCKNGKEIDYTVSFYFVNDTTISIKYIFPMLDKDALLRELNKRFIQRAYNTWVTRNKRTWLLYDNSKNIIIYMIILKFMNKIVSSND